MYTVKISETQKISIIEALSKGKKLKNGQYRAPRWELYKAISGKYMVHDANSEEWLTVRLDTENKEEAVGILNESGQAWFEE